MFTCQVELGQSPPSSAVTLRPVLLRAPPRGAHGRELYAAVAARAPLQLPVPAAPQQPGRPQLQRPVPVPGVPVDNQRLLQLRTG